MYLNISQEKLFCSKIFVLVVSGWMSHFCLIYTVVQDLCSDPVYSSVLSISIQSQFQLKLFLDYSYSSFKNMDLCHLAVVLCGYMLVHLFCIHVDTLGRIRFDTASCDMLLSLLTYNWADCMAYLAIEGAIYSHFYTKIEIWSIKLGGDHTFFYMDIFHGNTKFQSQNLLHKCYCFQNIHHFSLQMLNVTLASKMMKFC